MTLKGGTSGACAACKYQRRRCASDCPLAPYFPAEQPKIFQNVHRLFGVRSIIKILEGLDETQKPEAMRSIIWQACIRERNPVQGCFGLVQQLHYMIYQAEEELKAINSQLQRYRVQQNNNNNHNLSQIIPDIVDKQEDVTSQLDLGMGLTINKNNVTPFFNALPVSEPQHPQMSYTYSCSEVTNNGYTDSYKEILNDNNNTYAPWGQNQFPYNNNVMNIESQLVNLQMASNHQQEEEEHAHDYDEIHRFFDIGDDRNSFTDSKEYDVVESH